MMKDLLDTFIVEKLNPDVSRMQARSEKLDLFMLLDVNTEIYPIEERERYAILLTETLYLDGAQNSRSKADKFEYVMHGKLYKMQKPVSEVTNDRMEIYISFGGLQLLLEGSHNWLENFQLDKNYFICMRKLV